MIFQVEVKTPEEELKRGDLIYDKRKLLRVERVGKPHGKDKKFMVRFRIIGKVNLDRERRTDLA